MVTKDEIITAVWRSPDVADYTVTQAIYRLRKILGDHDPHESYIVCARSQGYQFTRRLHNQQSSPDVTDAAFRSYQRALSCRTTTTPAALNRSIRMLKSAQKNHMAPQGIRVVGLRPHGMPEKSSMREVFDLKATSMGINWDQFQGYLANMSHTKRVMELAEVANVAVFAASDRASGMTETTVNLTMGTVDD